VAEGERPTIGEPAATSTEDRAIDQRATATTAARPQMSAVLAAAAAAAGARAVLIALHDGYAAAGLAGLAARSSARHLLLGLVVALPFALALAMLGSSCRRRPVARLLVTLLAAVLADLFIVGRLPRLPLQAPGFEGPRALAAHAAGLGAALLVTWLLLGAGARWRRGGAAAGVLAAALAGLALVALPVAVAPRPHVLLISIDTLRADHLGCYGYELPTSPAIDRLAERSVRFEAAFAPEPWTLTSHVSLMTGLAPAAHGVEEDRALGPDAPTLAQALAAAGWTTAAVVDSVPWMDGRYGLDRGFHLYRAVQGGAAGKLAVVDGLLDDLGESPAFLFLHLFDVHSDFERLPYEAEPADRERFAGWYGGAFDGCEEGRGCASAWLQSLNRSGEVPDEDERRWLVSLYDAGIASLDRQIGRLLDALERRGWLQDAIVVLTADHGEEFFEHGRALHEQLYDESLRVPLLVRLPEGLRGAVCDELVGLVDVAPTLLELCGLPPLEGQGRSFARLLGEIDGPSVREALLLDDGQGRFGLRTRRHKLLVDGERSVLYDLSSDPGELREVTGEPELRARLLALLASELAACRQVVERLGPAPTGLGPGPEAVERLRALGYLGADESR
jgi:hypothetical protein